MGRLLNGSMMLAVLLAVIGGGAAYFALSGNRANAEQDTVPVVVLVRDVAVGTLLDEGDVRVEQMGAGGLALAGVATRVDEVTGRYALLPMVNGEPVLLAKVGSEPPGGQLAVLIPPGRVAVSVAVNDVISTGGFVSPGDRVDVLGVVTKEATDAADMVLEDIQVLAVSSHVVGQDARSGDASSGSSPQSLDTTVTLAVTVEEARRLVQVDELGRLRLALRPRAANASD